MEGLIEEKCIVLGCTNKKHQGKFIGDICVPCYRIIVEGNLTQPSNNFIHKLTSLTLREKDLLIDALIQLRWTKWCSGSPEYFKELDDLKAKLEE